MAKEVFNAVEVADQVRVIGLKMTEFLHDAQKVNNKAATRRARKVSLDLTKSLLKFRKDSIK